MATTRAHSRAQAEPTGESSNHEIPERPAGAPPRLSSTTSSVRPTGRPGSWSMCTSSMLTPISPASPKSRASSPGWSGTGHEDRAHRVGPVRRACRGWPGCRLTPALRMRCERIALGRVADRGDQGVELLAHLPQQVGDGAGVGAEDLLPQRRVAGGDPGDVADALSRERQVLGRCARPGGRRPGRRRGAAGARCARRRCRARPGLEPWRRRHRTPRPARPRSVRLGGRRRVRGDRPRAAVEERRAGRERARSARCRPSGASRRSGSARSASTRAATSCSGAALTLPTSVTIGVGAATVPSTIASARWSGGTATTTSCGPVAGPLRTARRPGRSPCARARARRR